MQKFSCLVSACISSKGKQKMQALTSEKKIQFSSGSEQTAVSLLVFRAFETKISPVLISPNQLTRTRPAERFSDMPKSITFTSFCRGISALLDSLPPSLCCLHPCHGRELWKVLQTPFIYPVPRSHRVAAMDKKGLFLPVPVQNRRQLLLQQIPGEQVNFFGSFGMF